MRWIVLILGTIAACGCADHRADLQTQAAQQSEQMQGWNNELIGSSRHPAWFQESDAAAVNHGGRRCHCGLVPRPARMWALITRGTRPLLVHRARGQPRLLVDADPVLCQVYGFVAGTVIVAIGDQLTPEEHPVVAQGVADDVAPMSQAEHHGDGAILEFTDDLLSAAQHRAAVPAGQSNQPITQTGVSRYVVTAGR